MEVCAGHESDYKNRRDRGLLRSCERSASPRSRMRRRPDGPRASRLTSGVPFQERTFDTSRWFRWQDNGDTSSNGRTVGGPIPLSERAALRGCTRRKPLLRPRRLSASGIVPAGVRSSFTGETVGFETRTPSTGVTRSLRATSGIDMQELLDQARRLSAGAVRRARGIAWIRPPEHLAALVPRVRREHAAELWQLHRAIDTRLAGQHVGAEGGAFYASSESSRI